MAEQDKDVPNWQYLQDYIDSNTQIADLVQKDYLAEHESDQIVTKTPD